MENPKIRFKGFTKDWEQRKFSDIATRESSISTSTTDVPSVEYEDVIAEEGRLNKDIHLKEAVKSGITFDGSQVLYGKLRPYLHNWLNPDFKGIAVGDWWVLKPINMDKKFLYRLIQTQQFDNIANQSSGSKMPRADWNLISNSEFMVPFSKEEQSKIGIYFDSLDHLITLHQRKCEQTKKLKKYMLQKMFPQNGAKVPEIRFYGFTYDWEQRKLKEIADKVSEKNKNNEFSEPFTNSAEQGIISQKDYFDREIVNNENLDSYYIVRNDDFIYNPRISVTAPVGPINRNRLGRNGVMSPLYTVFRTHDIDNLYLEFYFKTTKWHRFMKLNGDSGARFDRFTISSTQFMEMPIPYPMLDEQRKMGEYFDSLDHLITLHQRKCDELKKMKKYMLQNMFI